MTTVSITIDIDPGNLHRYTDEFLAVAWHVAQQNPAPFGDHTAGELVEHIGREIITRWLRRAPVALWHHQGCHAYHKPLGELARYAPPPGVKAGAPGWHDGTWTVRPDVAAAAVAAAEAATPAAAADQRDGVVYAAGPGLFRGQYDSPEAADDDDGFHTLSHSDRRGVQE